MLFNVFSIGIAFSFLSHTLLVLGTQPNMVTPPPSSSSFTFSSMTSNTYVINRLDTVKLDKAENICKGANGNVFVVAPMDVITDSKTYAYKIGSDGKLTLRGTIYHDGATATTSWGSPNSCYVSNGVLAVAVAAEDNMNNGRVYFYKEDDLSPLGKVDVGNGPDMVTATPDGSKFVVANEGEPNSDLQDPVGGISIIDAATRTIECTFIFDQTISETTYRANKVHRTRRAVPTNTDLEPEYITFNPNDSTKAYVVLQEANTIIIVSLDKTVACEANSRVLSINPLGWKSWRTNLIDASDRDLDGTVNQVGNFRNLPVYSMYQPDDINGFVHNGVFYIVTANEGDGKSPADFATGGAEGPSNQNGDEMRVGKINGVTGTDINWSPFTVANIKDNINLGRATIVNSEGDEDDDGTYSDLVMEGGRSFSIWKITTTSTELVYDSGGYLDQLAFTYCTEKGLIATSGACYDGGREDNKGTEPESLEILEVNGKRLLFVGLERANMIAMFDISDPVSPLFLQFIRDELNVGGSSPAGLASPEGIVSFPADKSPTGKPLLVASGETSLTITVFSIDQICTSTKKKACVADKKCTWKKVGKTSVCDLFRCSAYPSKKTCVKDKRCTWDGISCGFKPA